MSIDSPAPAPAGAAEPPPAADPHADAGRRIVRNSTLNLAGQGLNAAFMIVIVLLLAREGRVTMGQFYKWSAFITIVQLVAEAGAGTVLTRRLVQAPGDWAQTVGEAGGLFAGVTVLSGLVFVGVGTAVVGLGGDPDLWPIFALAGIACAALQFQRYAWGVFRAAEDFTRENWSKVLQGAAFAAGALAVAAAGRADLTTILAAFALSQILTSAYLLWALARRWPGAALGWRRPPLRRWAADTWLLGTGDVVRQLTWQVDTALLGLMQPDWVVGIYSLAYRPLGPINWLPRAVLTAAFPSFARQAGPGPQGLRASFAESVRLLWVLSLPIAVAACFYADAIVRVLAGAARYAEFAEAAVPLRILIWITLLMFISTQYRFVLAAAGTLRAYTLLVVGVFLLELVVEALLIPRWSYFGACAGSVLGELFFTVAGFAICVRLGLAGLDWRPLVGAVFAALGMAALLGLTALVRSPAQAGLAEMVAVTASATAAYFALCVCCGALRPEEVRSLWLALGRRSDS